jgi:hypothetical protein
MLVRVEIILFVTIRLVVVVVAVTKPSHGLFEFIAAVEFIHAVNTPLLKSAWEKVPTCP